MFVIVCVSFIRYRRWFSKLACYGLDGYENETAYIDSRLGEEQGDGVTVPQQEIEADLRSEPKTIFPVIVRGDASLTMFGFIEHGDWRNAPVVDQQGSCLGLPGLSQVVRLNLEPAPYDDNTDDTGILTPSEEHDDYSNNSLYHFVNAQVKLVTSGAERITYKETIRRDNT
jgi:hypothetical protein